MRPDSPELADQAVHWRSAYVHIPFCARICPYCDFAVVAGRDDLIDRYHRALLAEIDLADDWGSLDAVFIGGGTPSKLPAKLIGSLLERLHFKFGLSADVEVSMEANPEDIDATTARDFAAAGVNRLSLGVQSFDDSVLTALGRTHNCREAQSAILAARSAVDRVSIDLIYGHPSESSGSWNQTLATAVSSEIDHVSAYSLTVELGTALSKQVAAGAPAPDDDVQADRWERAAEVLSERFVRYEVSNYTQRDPCRYNMATWAQGEYLAFGLGAHGHMAGLRTRNLRRIDRYIESVEAGRRPLAGQSSVAGWDKEQERLMLGLRRSAGVVSGLGGRQLLESRPELVAAGIVAEIDGRLIITRPLLTDTVIREALAVEPPE